MAKEAFVQGLCMFPSTSQPGGDGRLSVVEDPFGSRRAGPFGQRREHDCDLLGGGFQTIQGSVTSSTERGAAGLTAKRLDALSMAMLAISNESMDSSVSDAKVRALRVGTGEPLSVYSLRCSSAAFDLAPGTYRSRRWPAVRRRRGGMATSRAIVWAAGFEQTVGS